MKRHWFLFTRAGRYSRPGLLTAIALAALVLPASAQKRSEESESYYKRWLEEDVVYIITPEEKEIFQKLSTPEEKDQFIEQFWWRRDPDPQTAVNEFKEEHYRRIAYVNERFHSGVPGWKTDRGKIYIRFGKPTGIEAYPTGGTYNRKPEEGGGTTWAYPFEVWFYNHLDGVGDGVEIEFVDYTRTGEYRIARDTDQKDALLYVPGAGQTLAEQFGVQTRLQRLRVRNLGNPDGGGGVADQSNFREYRYRDYPFQKLAELYRLTTAPTTKFTDLEKIVNTRITYDQFPVEVRSDVIQVDGSRYVVPVTFFVENHELTFKPVAEGSQTLDAHVNFYGRVETLTGRITYTFDEDVHRRIDRNDLESNPKGLSVFQRSFPLNPGRYKLSAVVRDVESAKLATLERALIVDPPKDDSLATSSVMLTRQVGLPPDGVTIGQPFVIGKYKVIPTKESRFSPDDKFVQAYFEVYNLKVDQGTLKPSVRVEISLRDGSSEIFPYQEIHQEFEFDQDRLLVYKVIPFDGLKAGRYALKFRITDLTDGRSMEKSVEFSLTG